MKKLLPCILMSALLFTLFPGCAPTEPNSSYDLTIAATTYPVYLFTTAVTEGVENVQVELVVNQQTSCLHDYTMTISDMKILDRADIIVMNGGGLEDFLSRALSASHAQVIDCSAHVEFLEAHEGHEHHGHHHEEEEADPHIWMSPINAAVMVDTVAQELSRLDGSHAQSYQSNAAQAIQKLEQLKIPDGASLKNPNLITFHDGFQYFAQSCGLTLLKAIEEEEGSEASASDVKEIISLIRDHQLPAIFTETNGSDATAMAIARETGVSVCTLNLLMSGSETGIEPYLETMEANYATVVHALGGN